MVYSDTTDKLGILQACERYCSLGDTGISGSSALKAEFTAHSNSILRRVWHAIFMASGSWEYDDSNQTDLPVATASIVNTQSLYSIPVSDLAVKRLEVKDSDGIWHVLEPLVLDDIGTAVAEFEKNDGSPRYYRILGNSLELFPAANYDLADALKIYFDRGSVAFASTDTTKTPGFASEYHDIVPIGASLEYKKIKTPGDASIQWLTRDYTELLNNIKQYYSRRFKDKKIVARATRNKFI